MTGEEYKFGFVTPIETEVFKKGLDEKTIRAISKRNKEPAFILDFRLKAFDRWLRMKEPHWGNFFYPSIDYQAISYHAEPKKKQDLKNLEAVDPEILKTLKELGIPYEESLGIIGAATDVVFDSVSLGTTFSYKLKEAGVVLLSISEAIQKYPAVIEKYLGTVVPYGDNFFAALNSAVFSDGSFVYVPKGVRCPIELSTYFRINEKKVGQFERTLIIADEGSYVSYLEGCTAPSFDERQLHAAVVELVALERAEIRYSTVQNWYPGDPLTGKGGIYNFVTKRGRCLGRGSKISWTQVEAGAAVTWKYPGCILEGDDSLGEFYSVSLTAGRMQADTGSRMIHLGKNTTSRIVSKSIAADFSNATYRGKVKVFPEAINSKSFSDCGSMLVGENSESHTFPFLSVENNLSQIEHEAATFKLDEEKIFYLEARGIDKEEAIGMIIRGFCEDVISKMPLEFALESQKLLSIKLKKAIG